MAKILYPQVITEELDVLKELEKYHRYSHLFQRVRMLRLLKSEECTNLGEAAEALGYFWRQCQRWFASYQEGGTGGGGGGSMTSIDRIGITHPKEPPTVSEANVERSLLAIIDVLDVVFQALYHTNYPVAGRRLYSTLTF